MVGCIGIIFCLMSYMTAAKAPVKASPQPKHKLGAGISDFANDDGSMDMQSTAKGLSVMLWGLVVAKAQQGFKATTDKDSATVKSRISNVTKIFGLIIAATLCQMFATNQFFAAQTDSKVETKKTLKSSVRPTHSKSFYDSDSSHYMGGAHNVALQALAEGKGVKAHKAVSKKNVKSLSGSNAAIADLMGKSTKKV